LSKKKQQLGEGEGIMQLIQQGISLNLSQWPHRATTLIPDFTQISRQQQLEGMIVLAH